MTLANSLVHQQYARKAEFKDIWDRLVSALPSALGELQPCASYLFLSVLSIFIYYSEYLHPRSQGLPESDEQRTSTNETEEPNSSSSSWLSSLAHDWFGS